MDQWMDDRKNWSQKPRVVHAFFPTNCMGSGPANSVLQPVLRWLALLEAQGGGERKLRFT